MKVLIIGGSGFLGASLLERFQKNGTSVMLLGRSATSPAGFPATHYVSADITDIESLRNCQKKLEDVSTVVHLAAAVPKTKEEDQLETMVAANVAGTANVLEVFGPQLTTFVYASSAEVYGLPKASAKIREDLLPKPLSYYGASKLAGELFCQVYSLKNDLPIPILRFTVLYGEGDLINRAVPNFIKQAIRGEDLSVFGGKELRDYLHIDDAAQALYLAATKPANGIYNIATGEGISILATAQAIIDAVNPKLKLNVLPREKPASDIVLDITKAKRELGFQPQYRFPDLIEGQIAWHKKH